MHNAVADALALATVVVANSSKYTADVVAAAKAAVNAWTGTPYGVSAAATFVFYLIGAMTAPEWIFLGAAVGLSAFTVYELLMCLNAGYDLS